MKPIHFIAIGVAVALVAALYFGGNTTPPPPKFLSTGTQYTINNPAVLSQLGATQPIVIPAGNYQVYNGSDGGMYIIVGQL